MHRESYCYHCLTDTIQPAGLCHILTGEIDQTPSIVTAALGDLVGNGFGSIAVTDRRAQGFYLLGVEVIVLVIKAKVAIFGYRTGSILSIKK